MANQLKNFLSRIYNFYILNKKLSTKSLCFISPFKLFILNSGQFFGEEDIIKKLNR